MDEPHSTRSSIILVMQLSKHSLFSTDDCVSEYLITANIYFNKEIYQTKTQNNEILQHYIYIHYMTNF